MTAFDASMLSGERVPLRRDNRVDVTWSRYSHAYLPVWELIRIDTRNWPSDFKLQSGPTYHPNALQPRASFKFHLGILSLLCYTLTRTFTSTKLLNYSFL